MPERDRYGDPVERPGPAYDPQITNRNRKEDDPEYVAWWKSWLNHCRQLLKRKP